MNKADFIKMIDAIEAQMQHDLQIAEHLSKAFPNAFKANLIPSNEMLHNALIECLEIAMGDTEADRYGNAWIKYFIYELDFGKESYRLKCHDAAGNEIKMATAGDLWEFLKSKNSLIGWIRAAEKLPEPLKTVWLTNGKGWVSLGCLIESEDGFHWAQSNGVIYSENGEIVSECESDDLDVVYWQMLPRLVEK